ncbi:Uncharacterised protein [Serratia grimesii]|jgi:hypothetical protein|nr:Uncharacterised protein [Serratia grimesii]SMZ57661.1 Uncharacterised protein [Serratia grimesii]
MTGGIQCWDASGKLIVDLGDYNTRYIGRMQISMPAQSFQTTAPYPGSIESGSFGVIISTSNASHPPDRYMTRAYDGGMRLYCIDPSFNQTVTVTIDVFSFL